MKSYHLFSYAIRKFTNRTKKKFLLHNNYLNQVDEEPTEALYLVNEERKLILFYFFF